MDNFLMGIICFTSAFTQQFIDDFFFKKLARFKPLISGDIGGRSTMHAKDRFVILSILLFVARLPGEFFLL